MKSLKTLAAELGTGINEILAFDQTLTDTPEIALALHTGDWAAIRAFEVSDDDADFIVDAWNSGQISGISR